MKLFPHRSQVEKILIFFSHARTNIFFRCPQKGHGAVIVPRASSYVPPVKSVIPHPIGPHGFFSPLLSELCKNEHGSRDPPAFQIAYDRTDTVWHRAYCGRPSPLPIIPQIKTVRFFFPAFNFLQNGFPTNF
jgi:hypothetical protein